MNEDDNFWEKLPKKEIEEYIKKYKKAIIHCNIYKYSNSKYSKNNLIYNYKKELPSLETTQELVEYCINIEQYDDALDFCELWCDYSPNSIEALNTRCTILSILSRFNDVIILTNKILTQDPKNIEALLNRALAIEQLGNPNNAIELAQYALELDPINEETIYLLAVFYRNTDNLEEAIKYYNLYLEIIKNTEDNIINQKRIYIDIAACYVQLNQYNNAIDIYNKLVNNTPYDKNLWYLIANIQLLQHKYKEAIASLENSIAIDNNFLLAIIDISELYLKIKDYRNSLYYFNKLLKLSPNNLRALICISTILMKQKKFTDAINNFLILIKKLNKKNNTHKYYIFLAYYGIGLCYESLNKKITALKYYFKTIQIYPNDKSIAIKIKNIYCNNINFFKKKLANTTTPSNKTINKLNNLIELSYNKKDYDNTLNYSFDILNKHPLMLNMLYLTAITYSINKKYKIASQFFYSCFILDPSFIDKYNSEIYHILKEKDIKILNNLLFPNKNMQTI